MVKRKQVIAKEDGRLENDKGTSLDCKLHLPGECHPCYVNKMVSHKVLFLPNSNLLRKNPSTSMLKKEATNNKALVRVPGINKLKMS